jgi:hypothetical protein
MSRFLTKILNEKPGEVKPTFEVVPKARLDQAKPDPDQTQTDLPPNQSQTQSKPQPDQNPSQTHPKDLPIPDPSQTTQTKRAERIQTALKDSRIIAPEKDFNKRANILERDALPNGLFPGASKAIYDALYLRTLGSVNSTRMVQATRKELMKWSGIKNIKTINTHLKKLKDIGLIAITNFTGEHTGSHYEVFLPNERNLDPSQIRQTKGIPGPDQKLVPDPDQFLVWVGSGKTIENKDVYGIPKTSLKTNTKNDDEAAAALAKFCQVLDKASENITGTGLKAKDDENWRKLAELLVMELEVAAARTESISNVPSFLTEHLRRRLLHKPETNLDKRNASSKQYSKKAVNSVLPINEQITTTEIPNISFEVEPLSEQGRKTVLATMTEYLRKGQREFVLSLQETYTTEDWQWLMNNMPNVKN